MPHEPESRRTLPVQSHARNHCPILKFRSTAAVDPQASAYLNRRLATIRQAFRTSRYPLLLDAIMTPRYSALLKGLSGPDRLERALALSALIRSLAWEGALRDARGKGSEAVRDRFLIKLYGARTATQLSQTIRSCSRDG